MNALGVILARAGSKGLPDKCVRDLLGRPVIAYTFSHARAACRLADVVFTTDSQPAKALARAAGIEVVDRPVDLASDLAAVDAAARHAVEAWEAKHGCRADVVVLLYGNIPVRAPDLIDRAIEHVLATGADSARSVAPVSKQHPDWVHRLDGDKMIQFRPNSIYRRQDLEPLYYHDGAVVVVTREALFAALRTPDDHQSFLGRDRRAILQNAEDAVDVDVAIDLYLAEAILRARRTPLNPPLTRGEDSGVASAVSRTACRGEVRPCSVAIGGRRVGRDHPVFVIAEAGVNHDGHVDTAVRMVDAAVEAGADAVKFQMFRGADLAGPSASTVAYQREQTGHPSQRDMLARLELTFEQLAGVKEHCDARGIIFLATPFGVRDVAELVELGAPAIKIASTDLTNILLVDAAVATMLPLIVSTGAATASEIHEAVARLATAGTEERLALLHCVSAYPAPIEAMNLAAIRTLAAEFTVPSGLSDHTTSEEVGAMAVAAGACILEKHFTLDRAASGPDHAMSLDPAQLGRYIARVREAERATGDGRLGMREIERPVREAARRSITAAVHIPAGTVLAPSMLTLKRPGTGMAPSEMHNLIGRRTKASIPGDTVLTWEMVESRRIPMVGDLHCAPM